MSTTRNSNKGHDSPDNGKKKQNFDANACVDTISTCTDDETGSKGSKPRIPRKNSSTVTPDKQENYNQIIEVNGKVSASGLAGKKKMGKKKSLLTAKQNQLERITLSARILMNKLPGDMIFTNFKHRKRPKL